MSSQFLIIGLSFLICLTLSAVLFNLSAKMPFLNENLLSAVVSICGTIILGILPLNCFFWSSYDFVSSITIWQYLTPVFSSLLILAALFIRRPAVTAAAILLASFISVFARGMNVEFLPQMPLLVNQLLTVAALWLFALSWKGVAALNPLPQITGITICGGLLLLFAFSLAPLVLGISAAGLLAALIIAYIYSSAQPVNADNIPFLGFVFGWLGLICAQEYLLPCFVTFAMFCLLEFCLCLFRKITLQPQYRELPYNSVVVQSFNDGLPTDTLLHIIWSTEVLLLIFGLLQVNSENSFSIPSFAAVIVAWQMYRLSHWQLASQTLKETNSALINEIKQGFGKIFSSAPDGKDKNDKTDKS